MPVEGTITALHSEVKLGPCTSVLRIVLQDIHVIINRFTLCHYTLYLELPTRAHLFYLLILIDVLLRTCTTIIIIINAKCAGTRLLVLVR